MPTSTSENQASQPRQQTEPSQDNNQAQADLKNQLGDVAIGRIVPKKVRVSEARAGKAEEERGSADPSGLVNSGQSAMEQATPVSGARSNTQDAHRDEGESLGPDKSDLSSYEMGNGPSRVVSTIRTISPVVDGFFQGKLAGDIRDPKSKVEKDVEIYNNFALTGSTGLRIADSIEARVPYQDRVQAYEAMPSLGLAVSGIVNAIRNEVGAHIEKAATGLRISDYREKMPSIGARAAA